MLVQEEKEREREKNTAEPKRGSNKGKERETSKCFFNRCEKGVIALLFMP